MDSHLQPGPCKQALVIVGMHRSGTSASTGALSCLGVNLGPRLYRGHRGINDKGYFEHSDIADTNDEALFALGSSWDDILLRKESWWRESALLPYAEKIRKFIRRDFSHSDLWAVKDPRVCRLLPWWLEILSSEQIRPHFLFVIRSPEAVHRSLERRDGFSREKSYWLWTLHYLEAERASRACPRVFVDFDHFIDHPLESLQRIAGKTGLSYPIAVSEARPCLEKFLSRDLRHHKNDAEITGGEGIVPVAHTLHRQLLNLTQDGSAQAPESMLDALWQNVISLQAEFPSLLIEQLKAVNQRRGGLQLFSIKAMRSWSWIIGKPFRYIERWFNQDV